jgi:hypothetical protein
MLVQFNNARIPRGHYIEIMYKPGIYTFNLKKNTPWNLTPKKWRQKAIRRKLKNIFTFKK